MADIEIEWRDRRRIDELDREWTQADRRAAREAQPGLLAKVYNDGPMTLTPPIGPNATRGTLRVRDELLPILTENRIDFRVI